MTQAPIADPSDGVICPECEGLGTISSFLMLCLDCKGKGRIHKLTKPAADEAPKTEDNSRNNS